MFISTSFALVVSLLVDGGLCRPAQNAAIDQVQQSAGYLAAIFKGADPKVFFHIANPQNPSKFQPLNGGAPSLVAFKGTGGARDPFILNAHDGSKVPHPRFIGTQQYLSVLKLYVLATDLDIGKTTWEEAQTHGSRGIFVWESTDEINWSSDRLVELMPATAGYVWAPSAIWYVQRKMYAVFWSSRVYDPADTAHTGPSQSPFIYYSHTNDFVSFTEPAKWDPNNPDTVIDQEIQYIGGTSYIRYLGDTQKVRRVVLDRSDNGLFGDWKRIGIPVDQIREGPASYQDILNPKRFYLWEDNYGGAGYECYYTETFQVPYSPCEASLTPTGMRHGGVVQGDAARYQALLRNITTSS